MFITSAHVFLFGSLQPGVMLIDTLLLYERVIITQCRINSMVMRRCVRRRFFGSKRGACLEQPLVKFPGSGAQVLEQGALVGEWEVEGEISGIFTESYLPQKVQSALLPLALLHAQLGLLPLHLPHREAHSFDAHHTDCV